MKTTYTITEANIGEMLQVADGFLTDLSPAIASLATTVRYIVGQPYRGVRVGP
jgi:hypothetical protein